jgi:hypothetical protein
MKGKFLRFSFYQELVPIDTWQNFHSKLQCHAHIRTVCKKRVLKVHMKKNHIVLRQEMEHGDNIIIERYWKYCR